MDEHHLLVNDNYAFLDRGIFNELARADKSMLESSLGRVGEQEDYANYLNQRLIKIKLSITLFFLLCNSNSCFDYCVWI